MTDSSAFDPTSRASSIASCLMCVAMVSLTVSSFFFGKFRDDRDRFEFQSSMFAYACAMSLFWLALYLFFAFD
jgi:hypothetical protein